MNVTHNIRRFVMSIFVAASLGSAAPAFATCPIAGSSFAGPRGAVAIFRYVGRYSGWPSDIALGVRSGQGRPTHWFLFDRGAARYINLISTTDVTSRNWKPPTPDGGERPLGDMHFVSTTASLAVVHGIPNSRDAAPSRLFLPDLPEVLAHRASPPEDVQLFFFKLVRCGGSRSPR